MSQVEVPPSVKKPTCLRATPCAESEACYFNRMAERTGNQRNRDFRYAKPLLNERDALLESRRCLQCVDAPCMHGCPGKVDVKNLVGHVADKDYYSAAKVLFTHNPLGWTCGLLCPTNHQCRGACNLAETAQGAIEINRLQTYVSECLYHMNVPQIRPPVEDSPNFNMKIALIGAGPASLTCATYLARIGYRDLTIFEKLSFPGGIPAIEIPQFRLPYHVSRFEVKMVEDLGVKFEYGKELGKDFTLEQLKEQGFEAVFVGVGFPEANMIRMFRNLNCPNIIDSKAFLSAVNAATKPGMVENPPPMPQLDGRVIVIGAGDVAADCSLTAFRCGAKKVTMCFRRGYTDMRCNEDEAEGIRRENVELVGFHSPKELIMEGDRCKSIVFDITKKALEGERYSSDDDQVHRMECDHIITAFGSQIGPDVYAPVQLKNWLVECDRETLQTPVEWVFGGGDCIGSASIIQAVNDGKIAAWSMHRFLAGKHGITVPAQPTEVPPFMTPIDNVDLTTNIGPLVAPNPFGIASGPSTESAIMIRRALKAGWGWVVTKTFQNDADMRPNVAPRIAGDPNTNTYVNIELNSERTLTYWEKELPKLKREFADRLIIASIHCKGTLDDWKAIATRVAATGVDGLQLNFPCPNAGEPLDNFTTLVRDVCRAVVEATAKPCFPKLGPYQGDMVTLARAAQEGGAAGISCINTIPSMPPMSIDGTFGLAVGAEGMTQFGGLSGAGIRPFALRSVAEVAKALPGFPILGCGGVENAETAVNFLNAGSHAVQACSVLHHKGHAAVQEMITGLQYHLYAQTRPDLREWKGQYPLPLRAIREHVPKFGPYHTAELQADIESILAAPLPGPVPETQLRIRADAPAPQDAPVPSVSMEVGKAVRRIATYADLDKEHKVVSVLDADKCLHCGKCYTACFDAGYCCIGMDKALRIPRIARTCRGCGLCVAVCPSGALSLQTKA